MLSDSLVFGVWRLAFLKAEFPLNYRPISSSERLSIKERQTPNPKRQTLNVMT